MYVASDGARSVAAIVTESQLHALAYQCRFQGVAVSSNIEFRKLWGASAAANLTDGILLVSGPLLASTLTRDPALIAGLAFAQRLPWLLFALLSGAVADRIDRRQAMVAIGVCRASLIGGLGLAVVMNLATLPLLYAIFFLLGTGETLFDISAAAVLPAVVPTRDLARANAQLAGALMAANLFVGPPLGGVLFTVDPGLPFLVGCGGLALAVTLLATLRGPFSIEPPGPARPMRVLGEIGEGVRWLWQHRLLRTLALTLGPLDLALVAQNSVMVLFVQERLGLDATGYGVLVSVYGAGGLLGSLLAHAVLARFGAGTLLRVAVAMETVYPAAMALADRPIVAGGVFLCFGFHAVVWGALDSSLRQELTPPRLRGRVESAYRFIESGAAAPGALVGGVLAAHLGLTAPFWLGAGVGALLLTGVWSTFSNATVVAARHRAHVACGSSRREE
jgi:MFS family permease